MPPEAFKGIFSTTTDVYSFGMILLELVTGLPPYSSSKKIDLVAFLSDLEKNGTDLVVLSDPVAVWPSEVAGKLIHLAKQCTDKDSHSRPLISQVLRQLEAVEKMQRNRLSYRLS
jgi:interleukin-1 receptor-associated kinase 4